MACEGLWRYFFKLMGRLLVEGTNEIKGVVLFTEGRRRKNSIAISF